jgi:hypothetical protein
LVLTGTQKALKKSYHEKADNHDGGKHNHKEVRAYARCLLCILPEVSISFNVKPEVQILLAALTASGLPHCDRAFLATCILKLLEESTNSKIESTTEDTNGIPF